jgi:hypothetical protein
VRCHSFHRVEDEAGNPLSAGRKTRVGSFPMKRALLGRDKGCRFPSCRHDKWLDALHVMYWADGGGIPAWITRCCYVLPIIGSAMSAGLRFKKTLPANGSSAIATVRHYRVLQRLRRSQCRQNQRIYHVMDARHQQGSEQGLVADRVTRGVMHWRLT